MLRSQLMKNDEQNSQTWLHRQSERLPLATGCQEQQNGRGSPGLGHDPGKSWLLLGLLPLSSSILRLQQLSALLSPFPPSLLFFWPPLDKHKSSVPTLQSCLQLILEREKKNAMHSSLHCLQKVKTKCHLMKFRKKVQPWCKHTSVNFKQII